VIKIESLTKFYIHKKVRNDVLKDVNLSIKEGEMIAVMGRSGVGKSTLLNIIAGLEKPSSGYYTFRNVDLSKSKYKELTSFRRENVGIILQAQALIDEKNSI